MNKQDDMIEVIPIKDVRLVFDPVNPTGRWGDSGEPIPTADEIRRRWMDPATAYNKKEGEAPDDVHAMIEEASRLRESSGLVLLETGSILAADLAKLERVVLAHLVAGSGGRIALYSPQSLGKTDANSFMRALLGVEIDLDSPGGEVPGLFDIKPFVKPIRSETKQNGRSAAYLKHDRSKQHRGPRRGRGR